MSMSKKLKNHRFQHNIATAAKFAAVGLSAAFLCMAPLVSQAEETSSDSPQSPDSWVSSVAWVTDLAVCGTQSEGLPLRPSALIAAPADAIETAEVVGRADASMWCVVPVVDESQNLYAAVASDYSGAVYYFKDEETTKFESDTNWIRAMAAVPSIEVGDDASPPSTPTEILAGTEDGKLVVLSIENFKQTRAIEALQGAVFDIEFSPDATQVAVAGGDGTVRLFSWPALEPVAKMSRGGEAIWCVQFVNDGQHIVSGGADRRIQLWDVAAAKSICTIAKTGNWITDLVAVPDSSLVVASTMDGSLVVVDHARLRQVAVEPIAKSAVWSLALSPSGNQLLYGTRKHGMAVMNVPDWSTTAKEVANQFAADKAPAPSRP